MDLIWILGYFTKSFYFVDFIWSLKNRSGFEFVQIRLFSQIWNTVGIITMCACGCYKNKSSLIYPYAFWVINVNGNYVNRNGIRFKFHLGLSTLRPFTKKPAQRSRLPIGNKEIILLPKSIIFLKQRLFKSHSLLEFFNFASIDGKFIVLGR